MSDRHCVCGMPLFPSPEQQAEAITLLRSARREHYTCLDCWYSCPKSEYGCCDETRGTECNCGAERFNATIDEFLARVAE